MCTTQLCSLKSRTGTMAVCSVLMMFTIFCGNLHPIVASSAHKQPSAPRLYPNGGEYHGVPAVQFVTDTPDAYIQWYISKYSDVKEHSATSSFDRYARSGEVHILPAHDEFVIVAISRLNNQRSRREVSKPFIRIVPVIPMKADVQGIFKGSYVVLMQNLTQTVRVRSRATKTYGSQYTEYRHIDAEAFSRHLGIVRVNEKQSLIINAAYKLSFPSDSSTTMLSIQVPIKKHLRDVQVLFRRLACREDQFITTTAFHMYPVGPKTLGFQLNMTKEMLQGILIPGTYHLFIAIQPSDATRSKYEAVAIGVVHFDSPDTLEWKLLDVVNPLVWLSKLRVICEMDVDDGEARAKEVITTEMVFLLLFLLLMTWSRWSKTLQSEEIQEKGEMKGAPSRISTRAFTIGLFVSMLSGLVPLGFSYRILLHAEVLLLVRISNTICGFCLLVLFYEMVITFEAKRNTAVHYMDVEEEEESDDCVQEDDTHETECDDGKEATQDSVENLSDNSNGSIISRDDDGSSNPGVRLRQVARQA